MPEKQRNCRFSEKSNKGKRFILSFIYLFTIPFVFALPKVSFAQDLGIPIIQNFSDDDYGGNAQIWSIVQDDYGLMYFGTGEGVMEYDGNTWRNIPLGSSNVVRSLAKSVNNKIYVGSKRDFGILEPDSLGLLTYKSLAVKLPKTERKFTNVWHTLATPNGIYFSTNSRVFHYSPEKDTLISWKPERRGATPMAYLPNYGLIYARAGVFFLFDGSSPKKIGVAIPSKDFSSVKLLPYSEHELLCIARKGVFIYDLRAKVEEKAFRMLETVS